LIFLFSSSPALSSSLHNFWSKGVLLLNTDHSSARKAL
jgi:hypothetical protein